MPHAVPCLSRFLLHGNDASSGENYQKPLKKKYNMLSFPPVVFEADKDSGDGNRSRDSFPFIELLVIYDGNREVGCC